MQHCWWGKDPTSLPATHTHHLPGSSARCAVHPLSSADVNQLLPGAGLRARCQVWGEAHSVSLLPWPALSRRLSVHCANAVRRMQTVMGNGGRTGWRRTVRGVLSDLVCVGITHTDTQAHAHMYTRMHAHTHTHYTHTNAHVHTHSYLHMHTHTQTHKCTHKCTLPHTHVHILLYLHAYPYIHTWTHTCTQLQSTHTHTDAMLVDTETHWTRRYREKITHCQRWEVEVEGWRVGKICEGGQKVQTSSYNINKSWGCNVQHGDYN